MKAWVLERQDDIHKRLLKLCEVEDPHPGDGEIRIKVLFCGICRTDLHIAEGDLPLRKPDIILGHEVVGVVDEVGKGVGSFKEGDLAGVSWLNSTCGACKFCRSGRENYCPEFKATGWDRDGGFAEYTVIREDFAFKLNGISMPLEDIAPVMCPGIAGYFALKLTEPERGDKLALYGFGPTAYYVLKAARRLGIDVYVSTRSKVRIEEAKKEGATWSGNVFEEEMPVKVDKAIIFPPAGNLVEIALSNLDVGGILVLAPVSSSRIVIEDYSRNMWGRDIKTLYNVRKDFAQEFLSMVGELGISIGKEVFPFEKLQDAMILMKDGKLKEPNAVVKVSE